MVVIAQHLDGHWALLGGTGASFHQDASLLQMNGPISSGGAEVIAIAWALMWIITSFPLHIPAVIHTDCMFGLAGTLRGHKCPTHAILLDMCASLFQTVRMTRRVSCHHVKGHSGHPWNEMAPRLVADAGDVLLVFHNKFFASIMSTRMLLYRLGFYDGPSCFLPRCLLLLLILPWKMSSWPCPDYVMPSRAIQPTSTSRSTCESCTFATVNVNTLLPNETAMEEGLLVPRRARWPINFWRLPSTWLLCRRRVLA